MACRGVLSHPALPNMVASDYILDTGYSGEPAFGNFLCGHGSLDPLRRSTTRGEKRGTG